MNGVKLRWLTMYLITPIMCLHYFESLMLLQNKLYILQFRLP